MQTAKPSMAYASMQLGNGNWNKHGIAGICKQIIYQCLEIFLSLFIMEKPLDHNCNPIFFVIKIIRN